ncbi:dethiobiotin synthase [Paenibacillus sp. YYML68]|uniref:dethiobiotin synthase n=1 Tax=Paenibacillus sp. YYML68 TaxID=2909250 RepID=UPI00249093D8|nr:dethiobiotin synthase [Paenibacillus sp. YYML68]
MYRHKGLFITATDTDVGKTCVTAALAAYVCQYVEDGSKPCIWKPVQSGVELGDAHADSYRLVHGSGLQQTEEETVTYTFKEPLAPWMAAERTGAEISWDKLRNEGQRRLEARRPLLVEGAGGLLVPLTGKHLVADLAMLLGLPIVIIARPGLGTVNHSLLTIEAARKRGLDVVGVILNGYTDAHDRTLEENRRMIETFGNVPVLGMLPWITVQSYSVSTQVDKATIHAQWRQVWVEELVRSGIGEKLRSFFT